MYSVRLGFDAAKKRIRNLVANGHYAEALLTSVFTFEKTVHRTLKQLMVSAGFRNEDADRLLRQIRGFQKQAKIWICFDPKGRSLPDIIGNKHWQHVSKAVEWLIPLTPASASVGVRHGMVREGNWDA